MKGLPGLEGGLIDEEEQLGLLGGLFTKPAAFAFEFAMPNVGPTDGCKVRFEVLLLVRKGRL